MVINVLTNEICGEVICDLVDFNYTKNMSENINKLFETTLTTSGGV